MTAAARYKILLTSLVVALVAIPLEIVSDIGKAADALKKPCDDWNGHHRDSVSP